MCLFNSGKKCPGVKDKKKLKCEIKLKTIFFSCVVFFFFIFFTSKEPRLFFKRKKTFCLKVFFFFFFLLFLLKVFFPTETKKKLFLNQFHTRNVSFFSPEFFLSHQMFSQMDIIKELKIKRLFWQRFFSTRSQVTYEIIFSPVILMITGEKLL